MAYKQTKHHTPDAEEKIESAIDKTESFLIKNRKVLSIILLSMIGVVGIYFAYKYSVVVPQQKKAADNIYVAEQLFAEDMYELALNGDGNNLGFKQISEKYGSTPQGNMARHYAGICCLYLGQPQQALDYLSAYKPQSGYVAAIVAAQNEGLKGDAYSQLGNLEEALKMYEKAASGNNQYTTPVYLKKAGLVCLKLGDYAKATTLLEKVKFDYPGSMEARDIDTYLGEAQQKL